MLKKEKTTTKNEETGIMKKIKGWDYFTFWLSWLLRIFI